VGNVEDGGKGKSGGTLEEVDYRQEVRKIEPRLLFCYDGNGGCRRRWGGGRMTGRRLGVKGGPGDRKGEVRGIRKP